MSNTHEFLVKDDEGIGQGDIGNCVKTAGTFSNVPDDQQNTIPWGISSKGSAETFAALAYRLGPSGEDPSRPIIKKGSDILSATLRVSPTANQVNNFDMRIATMKKDGRWDVDDVTFGGSFTWSPVVHVELNSNGGELAYNPATTTATSNNRLRHDGSTPGYGRISIGLQGLTSIISPTGTLNRIMYSYDVFPGGLGDEVWVEVWSKGAGFFDRGTLLATSDPHTSLPAAEPGFEVNSRAFTFSGSDRIELDDATRYVFVITSNTSLEAPRVFYRAGFINFLDASTSHGIGNGFGAPGYNTNDDMLPLFLTNNGNDTLLTNHIGTPVTFLNIGNWTAGVDFDFTGLDALIQGYIDDASYSSGDAICLVLDPVQGDSGDVVLRAAVSMTNDGVGLKLIVEWDDPDETPPTVTIDSISDGDCLRGTVTIDATAIDPQGTNEVTAAGVDEVRALLVGASPELIGTDGTGTASDLYSISFDTTLYPDGVYTLRVEAEDLATPSTNTGFEEISITIDNTAPTGSVTDPTTGDTVVGTIGVVVSASDATSGVASVELLVDGIPTGITDVTSPYLLGWDSTTVADGGHTLAGRMVDNCGNSADTAAVSITVANDVIPVFPRTESQVRVTGLSSVSDRTQAANLRVTGDSRAKPRGGSQLVVKKDT